MWRISFVLGLKSFIMALVASCLVIAVVGAHEYDQPFKWKWPEVAIRVEDRTYEYGVEIGEGTMNYGDNETDLTTYFCSGSCSNMNIIHVLGLYGPESVWAFADPLSQSSPCFDDAGNLTGNCNTTDKRVDFSYIYWNSGADAYPFTSSVAHYIGRHEMGHVFGFRHPGECGTWTIMLTPGEGCTNLPGQLTAHDKSDINNKY